MLRIPRVRNGKVTTYRSKYKNLWITIYLEDNGFAHHVGLNIYRSKRAQNDWYRQRQNRRAKRAAQTHNLADLRCWAACARLIRRVIDQHKGHLWVYPANGTRLVLLKYLEKYGFESNSNGIWFRLDLS